MTNADPLAPDKIAEARALVALKTRKAFQKTGGNGQRAAALLWAWTRSDANLRTAILRLHLATLVPIDLVPRGR